MFCISGWSELVDAGILFFSVLVSANDYVSKLPLSYHLYTLLQHTYHGHVRVDMARFFSKRHQLPPGTLKLPPARSPASCSSLSPPLDPD
ncbi:hypothetical protein F5Y14DRAFT_396780 [Nemania sp. NC0429]|nr:hypothetical protein F5Y14DRAFT_396780 [Nemania sp. NC0429]